MLFFANPVKSEAVRELMAAGRLGFIDTPNQRNQTAIAELHESPRAVWCADNGAFSSKFREDYWWRFINKRAPLASSCRFAVAPDVVADAAATLERSRPWLPRLRELGYPAAFVAQDGQGSLPVPWEELDCLFVGGSTDFKLGPEAAELAREARARGKWVHMGRVNSERRWEYARALGCDSADGTILRFGADANLHRLLSWERTLGQPGLWGSEPA